MKNKNVYENVDTDINKKNKINKELKKLNNNNPNFNNKIPVETDKIKINQQKQFKKRNSILNKIRENESFEDVKNYLKNSEDL